jgi:hypothetical protein
VTIQKILSPFTKDQYPDYIWELASQDCHWEPPAKCFERSSEPQRNFLSELRQISGSAHLAYNLDDFKSFACLLGHLEPAVRMSEFHDRLSRAFRAWPNVSLRALSDIDEVDESGQRPTWTRDEKEHFWKPLWVGSQIDVKTQAAQAHATMEEIAQRCKISSKIHFYTAFAVTRRRIGSGSNAASTTLTCVNGKSS